MATKLPEKNIYPHLAFFAATAIWAAAGPVIKLTLSYIPPISFLFIRFLMVCLIILPYAVYQLSETKVDKRDFSNFFLLGIFSQTSLLLVFLALNYTSVLDYTIMSVLGMIFTVYAGHYFYKEKVEKRITFGLILASLGTVVVALEPILQGHKIDVQITHRLLGNLLAISYNLAWLFYTIWSKLSMGERSVLLKKTLSFIHLRPMTKTYSPELIVTVSFYVGLLTVTPLAILENTGIIKTGTFNFYMLEGPALIGILYMVFLSSIVAYILHQWALEKSRVSDVAFYGYLGIVLTFPFAYILLGELPNLAMIIGGILVVLGVIIAESKNT